MVEPKWKEERRKRKEFGGLEVSFTMCDGTSNSVFQIFCPYTGLRYGSKVYPTAFEVTLLVECECCTRFFLSYFFFLILVLISGTSSTAAKIDADAEHPPPPPPFSEVFIGSEGQRPGAHLLSQT